MRLSGAKAGTLVGAALLIALAFGVGYRTTGDLIWPNEHDLYRDMASAQSILQEGFGHDPVYLGEKVWYNPLTPLAMAAAHRVTGLPLPVVVARCGAYLNLLAPVLFFLMVAVLLDGWSALLALAGFLFCVGGAFPSWAAATYSPWLYPVNFAQGFFYLLIIRLAALRRQPITGRWALLTGALLGLTFLAHTAPMLLFSGVLICFVAGPLWRGREPWWPALRRLLLPALLMAAVAAVVVLPYALSIVGHYHLHIVNPIPNGYVADFLGYSRIPLMIKRHLAPPVLVAWFGLYLVVRGRCDPFLRRILLPWVALCAAAVFYGYVVSGLAKVGVRLPIVVPAFHFLFYFKAALGVLFAIGVAEIARFAAAWLARRHSLSADAWTPRLGLALALALALSNVPAYLARYDFVQARDEALGHARERDRIAVYDWARAHARPDDVFLASDDMGLFGVAPAGPKVVAVDPYLSSPYVDCQTRARDRDLLFDLLARGDAAAFLRLARTYRVTYVVDETAGQKVAAALVDGVLHPVLAVGRVRLYRVEAL